MLTHTEEALPLIFSFSEEEFASTYAVRIVVRGRALVIREDDGEVSIQGLDPSGPSGGGDSLGSAWADFRSSFKLTLRDLIELSGDFDTFQATFRRLFGKAPEHMEAMWTEAVARAQSCRADDLELKTVRNYGQRGVEIQPILIGRGSEPLNSDLALAA